MKTHKVHWNNAPSKNFKKYTFGTKKLKNKQKLQLIWTYENMVKVFKKYFFHMSLSSCITLYIKSPNNKFEM